MSAKEQRGKREGGHHLMKASYPMLKRITMMRMMHLNRQKDQFLIVLLSSVGNLIHRVPFYP